MPRDFLLAILSLEELQQNDDKYCRFIRYNNITSIDQGNRSTTTPQLVNQ